MRIASVLIFLILNTGKAVRAQNQDFGVYYAVIGKPLSLSCITDERHRSIQRCIFLEAARIGTVAHPNNLIKPTTSDLENGICNFTIQAVEPKHITNWECSITYKYSSRNDRSDLGFTGRVKIVEAIMPGKPKILEKENVSNLVANSLVKANDNNNTVDLECCALNGLPKPTLAFSMDGIPKYEKQLTTNETCIKWSQAVFNLDDNGRTVSCATKHITKDEKESSSQDSFILNVLHGPTIIDEESLDKSPTTYVYKSQEQTEIRVRLTSNPIPKWKWSVYDPRSQQYDNIFDMSDSEDTGKWDNGHEVQFLSDNKKGIYEAVLLIRNTNKRNWKRYYALDLENEYGSTWTSFNVTQIVITGEAHLILGERSILTVSDSEHDRNNSVDITCCIRTGLPNAEVGLINLMLGEIVYARGKIHNESVNPFCYTWKKLQFHWTDNKMELSCKSEGIDDMLIRYGEENENQDFHIIVLNVLHKAISAPLSPELTTDIPETPTTPTEILASTFSTGPRTLTSTTVRPALKDILVPLVLIEPKNTTTPLQIKTSSVFGERVARIKYAWHPAENVNWTKRSSKQTYEDVQDGTMFGISTVKLEDQYTWETVLVIKNSTEAEIFFKLILENKIGKYILDVQFLVDESFGTTEMIIESKSTPREILSSTVRTHPYTFTSSETQTYFSTTAAAVTIWSTDSETGTTFGTTVASSETSSDRFGSDPSPSTSIDIGFNDSSGTASGWDEMGSTTHFELEPISPTTESITAQYYSSSTTNADFGTQPSETPSSQELAETSSTDARMDDLPHTSLSVGIPKIFVNSTGITVASTSFKINRIPVRFSAIPNGEVTWSLRGRAPQYQYEPIKNGNGYNTTIQQFPNGTCETVLIVSHAAWNNASKLEDTKKFFQVKIRNSAGYAKLDVVLIVNESGTNKLVQPISLLDSGVLKQYRILGILTGGFLVLGLLSILLFVADRKSLLCFHNKRGSFSVKTA